MHAVGKEVQALEDGGDHGPFESLRVERRVGDQGDDLAAAVASRALERIDEEDPGE